MLKLSGKTKTELLQIANSENTDSMDRYILADANFSEVLSSLLKRRNLSSEIIEAIGNNPLSREEEVLTLLSSHKNTPEETLQAILDKGKKEDISNILKNTSPEKLIKLTQSTDQDKQNIKIAMVKSIGLSEEKLNEIYSSIDKSERISKFNTLFAKNPFSGPTILKAILNETKEPSDVLAISGNRSSGDEILISIFEKAKSKDIDIANALISNSRTPLSLGEKIFEKFKNKLDEKTISSMIKRNLSLFTEKTLAKLFTKTELSDEQRKIIRLLEKNNSIFRLMLPTKMIDAKRRWIIGKSDLESLKDFARSFPEAENMLINYWSKVSGQSENSESNEKMKRLFSEEIWKDMSLSGYEKILHETKNTEVVRAVIVAQEDPELKEMLLLNKISSLLEDQVFEKIKSIAVKVKNIEGIETPEIMSELLLLIEVIKDIPFTNSKNTLAQAQAAFSDMKSDPVVLRKKATMEKLTAIWDSVSEFNHNMFPLVVEKSDIQKGEGDIYYIKSFSQLYEIANQINSPTAMRNSLISMSHRERINKLKEMLLFHSDDKENITLIIENSLPNFIGAIEGTKEKSKISMSITEVEREILRTEDKEYIEICERKRCFVNPVTEQGVIKKAETVSKYKDRKFTSFTNSEKNEFIGPLLDQFSVEMIKDFSTEAELENILNYSKEIFGVQKFKKILQAVSCNTKAMTMGVALEILEYNNLPFPIVEQKNKFENNIASNLISWEKDGKMQSHIAKVGYGNITEKENIPEKIIKSTLAVEEESTIEKEVKKEKPVVVAPLNLFEFADAMAEEAYLKL